MSTWKEGAEILQRLITAKELIPVQNDLINLQQTLFGLQSEQMKLVEENQKLREEIAALKNKKKYTYDSNHKWKIDPDIPDIKLCATCLNRDGFESPLDDMYDDQRRCGNCNNYAS